MGDSPRKNSKQKFEDDFLLFEDNDPDESGDSEEQINLPRSLILVERLIYTIEDEDPKLFDSMDDSSLQEFSSSNEDDNKPEEDDLEIPAFLRRQKN